MMKNRLFNILVMLVLVALLALTARDALATAGFVSRSTRQAETSVCASLPRHISAQAHYIKEIGGWIPYSENRPTGVDGGLLYVLSNSQACVQ